MAKKTRSFNFTVAYQLIRHYYQIISKHFSWSIKIFHWKYLSLETGERRLHSYSRIQVLFNLSQITFMLLRPGEPRVHVPHKRCQRVLTWKPLYNWFILSYQTYVNKTLYLRSTNFWSKSRPQNVFIVRAVFILSSCFA